MLQNLPYFWRIRKPAQFFFIFFILFTLFLPPKECPNIVISLAHFMMQKYLISEECSITKCEEL